MGKAFCIRMIESELQTDQFDHLSRINKFNISKYMEWTKFMEFN